MFDVAAALALMQYGDSAFPAGGFAFSWGVEGLAADGLLRDARGLERLVGEHATMLTVPGDIPRITADEVSQLIVAHRPGPSFTIAPAHDELGSNAILLSPPDSVKLRFGEDSYFPHLAAAREAGIEPTVVKLPGIGMDIDHPADLRMFLNMPRMQTRTLAFLEASGIATALPPP